VEGAELVDRFRHQTDRVELFQQENNKFDNERRAVGENFCNAVGIVLGICFFVHLNCRVNLFVNIPKGVGRGKLNLDAGFFRVDRHFLLDVEREHNSVARIDLAAADKAVDAGILRDDAHKRGHHHMQRAQILHGGGSAKIADELFQLVDIDAFVKEYLRITAIVQYVRDHGKKGIVAVDTPAVIPVAKLPFAVGNFHIGHIRVPAFRESKFVLPTQTKRKMLHFF